MKNSTRFLLLLLMFICSRFSLAQNLTLVKDINTSGINNSFPQYLTTCNNKIYFVAGDGIAHKLYTSDGTTTGTKLIGPSSGNGIVYNLTFYNNNLFFTYDDGINGLELWVSDGTATGTMMLKDIWAGSSSSLPRYFTICNGLLFFQASTAARSEGLWVTDGTANGTKSLGNFYAGPFNSTSQFLVFNNKIYFQGNSGSGYGMWSSDGTIAGTLLVKSGYFGSSEGNYAVCNDKFYFTNADAINGNELWISDGTSSGTAMVKDIYTGIQSSSPKEFICSNNKVYFNANDGVNGTELWVSDGTALGTKLVKDILTGGASSTPGTFVNFKSELYFFAFNGSSRELYKTNGTLAGTELISALTGIASVPVVYEFNSKLYFFASNVIGGGAVTIYESNGKALGTKQITPIVSSYFNYSNESFLGYNSELYLPAYFEAQGLELCKLNFSAPTTIEAINLFREFKVYPNPASENITIEKNFSLKSSKYDYYIYNSKGQLIIYGNSENSNTLNISTLAKDYYLLKITSGDISETIKFIKL